VPIVLLALLQIVLDELSRKALESRGAQGFARFFAIEKLGMNWPREG
jgi:hypothetical protein